MGLTKNPPTTEKTGPKVRKKKNKGMRRTGEKQGNGKKG